MPSPERRGATPTYTEITAPHAVVPLHTTNRTDESVLDNELPVHPMGSAAVMFTAAGTGAAVTGSSLARRDRLDPARLTALVHLGIDWAR